MKSFDAWIIVEGMHEPVQSLFEEKLSGNISSDMFKRMTIKYESEQRQLVLDLEQLEAELALWQKADKDLTGWIKRIKECLDIDTISRALIVELIDRIEVSERYNESGEQFMNVNIFYKFGV